MPSNWATEFALYNGVGLGELHPGHGGAHQHLVFPDRGCNGRLLSLDSISICDLWNRSSGQTLVCRIDCVFARNARGPRFYSIVLRMHSIVGWIPPQTARVRRSRGIPHYTCSAQSLTSFIGLRDVRLEVTHNGFALLEVGHRIGAL